MKIDKLQEKMYSSEKQCFPKAFLKPTIYVECYIN